MVLQLVLDARLCVLMFRRQIPFTRARTSSSPSFEIKPRQRKNNKSSPHYDPQIDAAHLNTFLSLTSSL
ncbi:hypothetical protein L2E82_44927 [Cichorium intybus]|uniref:Uncharacterized protein n=1 Tax=Cichorium intybus TaxID=13427 RepID=A0ACB8ZSK3_CICIN|nr:hypothetical protein L2E82_44927 [Cichorium intybus]